MAPHRSPPLKALALVSALALGGFGAGAATRAAVAPQPAQAECMDARCQGGTNYCFNSPGLHTRCSAVRGGCETLSCGDQLQVAD